MMTCKQRRRQEQLAEEIVTHLPSCHRTDKRQNTSEHILLWRKQVLSRPRWRPRLLLKTKTIFCPRDASRPRPWSWGLRSWGHWCTYCGNQRGSWATVCHEILVPFSTSWRKLLHGVTQPLLTASEHHNGLSLRFRKLTFGRYDIIANTCNRQKQMQHSSVICTVANTERKLHNH